MKGGVDAERDPARLLPVRRAPQLLAERQVAVDGLVEGLLELLDLGALEVHHVRDAQDPAVQEANSAE